MVPFRMVEIDRAARRRAENAWRPAAGEYQRQVQALAHRVDPAYVRPVVRELGVDLVNRITGAPIASTNAGIVTSQGDAMFGDSKRGTGETVVVALATLIAAGALILPGGVDFHGAHWCAGPCRHRETS